VPKDSDVESIEDLRGETVGFTSAGSVTQNTAALSFDRVDGIGVDDVELSAMGGVSEGLTAVESGDIAAAANLDPVFSSQQQDEKRWNVVFWASDFIDQFQQTCIIAGTDVLENNPDAVEGYLRARARGVQFIQENPGESAEIFASYNDGYDTATMRSTFENVAPDTYYTGNGFNVEGLQVIEEGMRNIDLIDREVGWTDIIDQSYLPEDKQTDLSALGE
jgi:NitT/TauT family transport system substrate-binding protein